MTPTGAHMSSRIPSCMPHTPTHGVQLGGINDPTESCATFDEVSQPRGSQAHAFFLSFIQQHPDDLVYTFMHE